MNRQSLDENNLGIVGGRLDYPENCWRILSMNSYCHANVQAPFLWPAKGIRTSPLPNWFYVA